MAHDINITNNTASFVSLRQSAWHGLGKIVNNEMTDAELLDFAGLNWSVEEQPVFRLDSAVQVGDETLSSYKAIPGHKLLMRSDTRQELTVVDKQFRVFQNVEMAQLMRRIGGDSLVWETAGCLGRTGATTFCLARMPDLAISLGKDDKTEFYMLISNGHGNNRALTVMPTMVRVVCANTMRAAEGDAKQRNIRHQNAEGKDFSSTALAAGYSIHHNQGLDTAVREVEQAYKLCLANKDATKVAVEMMAANAISDADARLYWERVLGELPAPSETERVIAMREEREALRRRQLATIWSSPTSQTEASRGTVYGAMQAAVEWVDHNSPARNATTRAFRSVMGTDVKTKASAWSEAMKLVGAAA